MPTAFETSVHAKAIQLSKSVLNMCAEAGSGHPTTGMSLAHITTVLMYHAMRWLPNDPDRPTSDRLVLSAGHAVPIVYAAYADLGGVVDWDGERKPLTMDDLKDLRKIDSPLDGHPNPAVGVPFFDAATGSLGQGLSAAAGLGLAARTDGTGRRVYCIIGDGEAREGQIWEAVDFIIEHRLTNVLPIINCNQYGQSDAVSRQQSPEVLQRKLEAAGFKVDLINGHDPEAVQAAIRKFEEASASFESETPICRAIVAKTVKGWGAPSVQGHGWHGKPPTGPKLEAALGDLDARKIELVRGVGHEQVRVQPKAPAEYTPVDRSASSSDEVPTLDEAMQAFDMPRMRGFATRKAYGLALRMLGRANPDVVVLDADVKNSTFAEMFAKDPACRDRFFECRIAEQHMISAGVGLSAAGRIPFCSSFAKFITRAYDQIEMAINSGANLKIVGSHVGVSLAADGPSQMGLPDVAWFRSFTTMKDHKGNPGCYVLQPSDAYSAYALTQVMAEHDGVCYMRTLRPETEYLYSNDTVFNLGGFEVLTEGRDLLIVTAGYMVHEVNKALDALDKHGIDATVVDAYSLPFAPDGLLDLAQENDGMILTVEDNYGAALGSAVADAVTEDGGGFTMKQMHVERIPKSGRTPDDILKSCGLHHTDIVRAAGQLLGVATS
ncbi:MAG: transketolase [Planctomycetota bacterium]